MAGFLHVSVNADVMHLVSGEDMQELEAFAKRLGVTIIVQAAVPDTSEAK